MSVTTLQQQSPIHKFRSELMAMTPELANALPSHIKPEKFQRVILTVVQLQPDLLSCDRRSLFAACLKCAADGLVPDGREAALVKYGTSAQYLPMFTGVQKRVRNSGEIASIQSHVIYEHDEFVWQQGVDASITHKPKFPGDRGKPVGVYAIAKFKDGSDPQIEVMDLTDIERVRKVSKAASSGPWVQWWDEMARKTVFRRLAKWLPLDAETDAILRRDDEAGAPTIAEPAGVVLEGAVETAPPEPPDSFEAAARGQPVTIAESPQEKKADPPRGAETDEAKIKIEELVAKFANTDSLAAHHRLVTDKEVSKTIEWLKKARPERYRADLEPFIKASFERNKITPQSEGRQTSFDESVEIAS
jgi:recombination protein RecT